MSKRDFFGDNDDGPASKMRKVEESDDGGRRGRVRKKSAKVLEMEEFEQAEKVTTGNKKCKVPKGATPVVGSDGDMSDGMALPPSSKKTKATPSAVGAMSEATPTSRKSKKNVGMDSSLEESRLVPAELSLRTPSTMMVNPMPTISNIQQDIKPEVEPASTLVSSPVLSMAATTVVKQEIKQENPKSVIKHLLTSPVAGAPQQIVTTTNLVKKPSQETPSASPAVVPSKKSSKKIKFEDALNPTPPPKKKERKEKKEKKMKIEIMSPSEIGPPVSTTETPTPSAKPKAPSLKMKIMSGSNPMTAQVAMDAQAGSGSGASPAPKAKKTSKKVKVEKTENNEDVKPEITSPTGGEEKAPKKKKVSKKKEKLIQDAISAAKQMPNLAALVSPPQAQAIGLGESPSTAPVKSKKKTKSSSPGSAKTDAANTSDSLVMDFGDAGLEDEAEESTLVIAETEKKKKKSGVKKKSLKDKEKEESSSPKAEKAKKIPKRAPTAYMLFCNNYRPDIVAENPGIEFAGISRKLGELWQTQSNKQKLQWRRKAQRRMKKSNLISTGKTGGKESQGGGSGGAGTSSTSSATPSSSSVIAAPHGTGTLSATNKRLALMLQKSKPAAVAVEEGPLSPTKVGIDCGMLEHDENDGSSNFSIEPLDVAAHLKLLGESLSIIGMRLQEHKGMIAVQGSLSVLLDSLLCACGPLLCLTQQVPGMDGCLPSVHAQTLDSVAYVMPGL